MTPNILDESSATGLAGSFGESFTTIQKQEHGENVCAMGVIKSARSNQPTIEN